MVNIPYFSSITPSAMANPKLKLPRLFLPKISRPKYHTSVQESPIFQETTSHSSNLTHKLKEKLKCDVPKQSKWVSIYKVPEELRRVEPKAYTPSIVSIGPYHHGQGLKSIEDLKWVFFRRLFGPHRRHAAGLDAVVNVLQKLEPAARSCYSDTDQFDLSPEGFVEMMLMDGCFVVELFRNLEKHDYRNGSSSIKRWMLPTLRRDLIKLENQLPLFVLSSIFRLTSTNPLESSSFRRLAIQFLNPLLQRNESGTEETKANEANHLLDLFRSSLLPTTSFKKQSIDDFRGTLFQDRQPEMIRSVTELVGAGIKIEVPKTRRRQMEVTSEGRVLQIPPIHIDDYRGTLFRNMVAFEKCHGNCKPDVTTYLFFLDGLINSSGDVGLLHYKGVLEHSLGSNREVARLVNKLCKEVTRDGEESYLYKVVDDANFFYGTWYAKVRSGLVRHYFSSWVVGVSTVAAMIALYLTLVQTGSGIAGAMGALEEHHFLSFIKYSFFLPFLGKLHS